MVRSVGLNIFTFLSCMPPTMMKQVHMLQMIDHRYNVITLLCRCCWYYYHHQNN